MSRVRAPLVRRRRSTITLTPFSGTPGKSMRISGVAQQARDGEEESEAMLKEEAVADEQHDDDDNNEEGPLFLFEVVANCGSVVALLEFSSPTNMNLTLAVPRLPLPLLLLLLRSSPVADPY
ncbi:unnamed protein product, partial [Thlaspi arvense]